MIIDAHTHFTTAPAQLQAYRGQQITNLAKPLKASGGEQRTVYPLRAPTGAWRTLISNKELF